jgi:diguanylate cyclase (GGDEF)-like protein
MDEKRIADFVARYGGEEFAVVLPDTDKNGALDAAERIKNSICNLGILHEDSPFNKVTVSIGVANCLSQELDSSSLINAADEKLYKAKRNGRNQVI